MNYVVTTILSVIYSTIIISLVKTGSEVNPFHIA